MGVPNEREDMPPINESRNPIRNPPTAPNQLNKERTIISAPSGTCLSGVDLTKKAQTTIRTPQTTPRIPTMPPMPVAKNVTSAPITAREFLLG